MTGCGVPLPARANTSAMSKINVRPAQTGDCELVCELIHELAEYEKLAHACLVTPGALRAQLFGVRPAAECVMGELDGVAQGFALFFQNFSTFMAKPGLYLEDLFVRPAARGQGLGEALLRRLAQIACERGYGRMEWSVLDWNEPAIGFYRKLGAMPMDEWTVFRVTGDSLTSLANADRAG